MSYNGSRLSPRQRQLLKRAIRPVIELLPGDIGFLSHKGFVSDLIRWGQRSPGWPEGISHTFVFVGSDGKVAVRSNGDPIRSDLPYAFQKCNVVEANADGVEYTSIIEECDKPDECYVALFRLKTLTDWERKAIAGYALLHADKVPYGILNIFTSLVDRFTKKYLARKATLGADYPDCSVLVAESYKHGARYSFGLPAGGAIPQVMYDYCLSSPDWERLHSLSPLYHTELKLD